MAIFRYHIILFLILLQRVNASRILLLVHLQGSHLTELSTIAEELVQRGHEVYTILPDSSRSIKATSDRGIKVITFSTTHDELYMDSDKYDDIVSRAIFAKDVETPMTVTTEVTKRHCQKILENDAIVNQIRDLQVDLAMVDGFLLNYCHYILPHMLSIPHVSIYSSIPYWDMGIPALPSFVNVFMMEASDNMSFMQRLESTVYHVVVNSAYFPYRRDTELLDKYTPDVKTWNELLRETQFYIALRDEILEWPVPRMPNTLFLPGITYKPPKNVKKNIQEIIDKGNSGIFVMSFGSTAGFLPDYTMKKFMSVFNEFQDYQILWRFPIKTYKDFDNIKVPSNVHLLQWLPQNDILGHPKTKLFITHCGNNGQYETIYHGVPMIGFPLFAEQDHNAFRMVDHGYGVRLDIFKFTTAELRQAIIDVTTNKTMLQSVRKASAITKDRIHPVKEAAYWLEHILKFGGKHLRGISMDMPWYKLLMVDIMIFLLLLTFGFTFVFIYLIKLCCAKKKKKDKHD